MAEETKAECEARWTQYAIDYLLGKQITGIRYLSDDEMAVLGWGCRCLVLELSDGTTIYPSRDDEGNDAGSLFGTAPDGKNLAFPVMHW
jgi:hypothetical protein